MEGTVWAPAIRAPRSSLLTSAPSEAFQEREGARILRTHSRFHLLALGREGEGAEGVTGEEDRFAFGEDFVKEGGALGLRAREAPLTATVSAPGLEEVAAPARLRMVKGPRGCLPG